MQRAERKSEPHHLPHSSTGPEGSQQCPLSPKELLHREQDRNTFGFTQSPKPPPLAGSTQEAAPPNNTTARKGVHMCGEGQCRAGRHTHLGTSHPHHQQSTNWAAWGLWGRSRHHSKICADPTGEACSGLMGTHSHNLPPTSCPGAAHSQCPSHWACVSHTVPDLAPMPDPSVCSGPWCPHLTPPLTSDP